MYSYLLALEIEPVEIGKVYIALPLHATTVHWFTSLHKPADIVKAITPLVESHNPIEIVGGEPDLFGLDKDVPVNRIANYQLIRDFHIKLHQALQPFEIMDTVPKWTGEGFNPHITRQQSGRFEEGRVFTASKLYVVEAADPELRQKKIITKLSLKGAV